MLIQFAVENYLSFKERAVFSMLASDRQEHPAHVCDLGDGLRVLRCAALYGANASGKSNLVKALQFAQTLVTEGTRPGARIDIRPFKLGSQVAPASRFEFEVFAQGRRYSYGFIVNSSAVEAEWLYSSEGGVEQMLFERSRPTPEAPKTGIQLGEGMAQERQRIVFVAQGTRPEQLFLTEAEDREVAQVKPLTDWFRKCFRIIPSDSKGRALVSLVEKEPELLPFMSQLLREAGTGIADLQILRSRINLDLRYLIEGVLKDGVIQFAETSLGDIIQGESDTAERVRLVSRRLSGAGNTIDFELEEESDGTRRLLQLAPTLYDLQSAPIEQPAVHVMDELERSLHPLLSRMYLGRFLAKEGCGGAQMICTTHDTNLLDLDLLRADEIWFAEKDQSHSSHLYSLGEFKRDDLDRLGSHLEQGYLNGRFGAIPFFGTHQQLGLPRQGK